MEEGQVVRRDKISGFLDRAIWWSLVAMIVAIPLAETPKTICFISALVCWLVKMAITRDFRIKIPRLGWFLLAWLGATFLSTFNSECGIKGVSDVLTYVPFFLLIVNVVDSERRIMQLFWAVVIGIGIGDVAGLWKTISEAVRMHTEMDRLYILSLGVVAPYLVMVLSLMMGVAYYVRWDNKSGSLLDWSLCSRLRPSFLPIPGRCGLFCFWSSSSLLSCRKVGGPLSLRLSSLLDWDLG